MKLIVLLLFTSIAFSQTISGTVYDENQLAMPGVSVYLDGTSIGTVTNDDGTFELTAKSRINTSLVFSFIGYENVYVPNPFEKTRYEAHMAPKASMLNEVVISNDGFSRKDKLKAFREQFLGQTKAGRSCTIANEDDIDFTYDYKTFTLKAFSQKPLKITNAYLGYAIEFNLVEFYVTFSRKSIKSSDAYTSAFAGTTVFREIKGDKAEFGKRRVKSYLGSQSQFFRNLVASKWGKDDFQLYKGSFPADPKEHFDIVYRSGMYEVTVKETSTASKQLTLQDPVFVSAFNLLYNGQKQSRVTFNIQKILVDEYGNTNAPLEVMFSGEMSKLRMGDLLPMDYTP